MKGNTDLINKLNALLADELTAISQYMVHSEMCDNWGYERLHKMIEARAMVEMKHAEKLIGRIIFLEGTPIVSKLNPMKIGAEVPKMFQNDLGLENDAVNKYNEAVKLAVEVGDNATRQLLDSILADEDGHVDEIEENLDQIGQIGVQVYLGQQIRE